MIVPSRARTARDDPAHRLAQLGPRALATAELLSLLVEPGRGRERAARAVSSLASSYQAPNGDISLRAIAASEPSALAVATGLGGSTPARLLAALELGRRAIEEVLPERDRLRGARDAYERMRVRLRDVRQEEFWVLLLNTHQEITAEFIVARGTVEGSLVHPREIFRNAVREAAASIVMVHNHPSGDPTPSPEDHEITRSIFAAAKAVGIPVLDHVIIGEGRFFSYSETGMHGSDAVPLVHPPSPRRPGPGSLGRVLGSLAA
jgi:DNA repair protein RadC